MEYYSLYNESDKKDSEFGEIAKGVVLEKKSKFYAYLFHIESKQEAIQYIESIRKAHKEARHVVYIYSLLNETQMDIQFSDDGEPKGTGTKAIYALLTKEHITNICIVIVRYFGGILLGASLLSRTYLNSAREAINLCTKKEIYHYIEENFSISYSKYTQIKPLLDKYILQEVVVLNHVDFNENVAISAKVREDQYEDVLKQIK